MAQRTVTTSHLQILSSSLPSATAITPGPRRPGRQVAGACLHAGSIVPAPVDTSPVSLQSAKAQLAFGLAGAGRGWQAVPPYCRQQPHEIRSK